MTKAGLIDQDARQQALDISNSYCVQAPAGSGKTELLVQRYLKLLAHCEEPENILAITFTRKAAFEMRQRLLGRLRRENDKNASEQTTKLVNLALEQNHKRQWHLLDNPQRLQIKTIDSFNAAICAQLPVVSGLGGQVSIIENMEPVFQQVIEQTLEKLESDTPIGKKLTIFLTHLDNNLSRARRLLVDLLYKRDQWLGHILRFQQKQLRYELSANLQKVILDAQQQAYDCLYPYAAEILNLLDYATTNLSKQHVNPLPGLQDKTAFPDAGIDSIPFWSKITDLFLTKAGEFRKIITAKEGFPAKSSAKNAEEKALFENNKQTYMDLLARIKELNGSLQVLQDLQILPATEYKTDEWSFIEALTEVLIDAVSELNISLNQNNIADYIHVSASAIQALDFTHSSSDISLRLDSRINHILVDEFQDTSLQQIKLLERLTTNWQANESRSLFIVGDGMQSCYSFRNANVGLFLKARDEGIGNINLNSLQLQVNFRSSNKLVAWVNTVFKDSFPQQDNINHGAVAYTDSHALNDTENSGVSTTLLIGDNAEPKHKGAVRQNEAELVMKQVKKLLSETNVSIAILVRTRSHLSEIIPLLKQANIPWNANDIDPLNSISAVSDLLSLLRALTNLADKTALLALMRTPFIGLSLKDIHYLEAYAEQNELSFWQTLKSCHDISLLSPDAQNRLQLVIPILIKFRSLRLSMPVRNWLEYCWIQLGGPASLSSHHDLKYIERFFLLLASETVSGEIRDIHAFEKKCSTTYLNAYHDNSASLHIMTIHKAKGLEFDYVLIPGLDREPRSNQKALFLWHEYNSISSDSKLLLAPLNASGEADNPTYQYLKKEEDLRSTLENTRLLYIAITRAKRQAFLFAGVKCKNESYTPPAKLSLLASIWPTLSSNESLFTTTNVTTPKFSDKLQNDAVIKLPRLKHNAIGQQQAILLNKGVELTIPATPHEHLLEKKIGELIHESLRLTTEKQQDILDAEWLVRMESIWRSQLKPVCIDKKHMNSAIQLIRDNLSSCMSHDKSPWLFDHSHEASACELAISDYRYQWRKEYIVDRTFVDQGVRWVIDYKSTRKPIDQNMTDFLYAQEQQYRSQLSSYVELFRQMDKLPVKAGLFFTALPYLHEIKL